MPGKLPSKQQQLVEFLEGRTIKEIATCDYQGWTCIESITLENGDVVKLWGSADCAILDIVANEDGEIILYG